MATRRTVLSQTERSMLREASLIAFDRFIARRGTGRSPIKTAKVATLYARALVTEFRNMIWSDNHE